MEKENLRIKLLVCIHVLIYTTSCMFVCVCVCMCIVYMSWIHFYIHIHIMWFVLHSNFRRHDECAVAWSINGNKFARVLEMNVRKSYIDKKEKRLARGDGIEATEVQPKKKYKGKHTHTHTHINCQRRQKNNRNMVKTMCSYSEMVGVNGISMRFQNDALFHYDDGVAI